MDLSSAFGLPRLSPKEGNRWSKLSLGSGAGLEQWRECGQSPVSCRAMARSELPGLLSPK